MKITLNKVLLVAVLALFISCDNDDSVSTNCSEPAGFELVSYNNGTQVTLNWTAEDEEEVTYEVEYGFAGFELGTGAIETTISSPAAISNLDFNIAYDFYVRRLCGEDVSSNAGPVSNTVSDEVPTVALMNANIDGVQFNNMKPFLYNGNNGTRVVTFSGTDENFLGVQGNSAPFDPTFDNSKEINLFIPQSQWAPGTYALTSHPTSDNGAESNVNIIYHDSSTPATQAYEEEDGTITITTFDTVNRIVKGTFEFRFKLYYVNSGEFSEILECTNGTFQYTLDASFFD